MTGKIFEKRTGCGTQEFTLDYTQENTFYLSSVAYGEWDTQEFETEDKLDEWLKDTWSFSDSEVKELKQSMYIQGE